MPNTTEYEPTGHTIPVAGARPRKDPQQLVPMPPVTRIQLAQIIAALRCYQEIGDDFERSRGTEHFPAGGSPLTQTQIESLHEQLAVSL